MNVCLDRESHSAPIYSSLITKLHLINYIHSTILTKMILFSLIRHIKHCYHKKYVPKK